MSENQLINETSPYLLQHANNPVHWYPWGETALKKAREENKLILLSIGYSACHWCHVMAHESFEDEATAEIMNRDFINIKIDREERPDLDRIYQAAHHLLNQRAGGWPLTAILTPDDHVPFFIGTYFPKTSIRGMPSLTEIMEKAHSFYHDFGDQIIQQNESLQNLLHRVASPGGQFDNVINDAPFVQALEQLKQNFDSVHGGFGGAPKFPHPTNIEYLLRYWSRIGEDIGENREAENALQMARSSLLAMATGGIYDQLGGGFYRYSVDEQWMIPHFEKMLYDNGPLLGLYAWAYKATGEQLFKRIATETAQWVTKEMQSPEGAYYSTLDADSEGEEGKFYVWEPDQVRELLTNDEFKVISHCYGLNESANFEGKWHLYAQHSVEGCAEALNEDREKIERWMQSAKQKLLARRETRVHPGRDEKILTSWNGLMIKGMAITGRLLDQPDYLDSATRAVDFIRNNLFVDGMLLATCKDGKTHLNAYLDDYIFVLDGLLELLQGRWRDVDLNWVRQLADVVLDQFEDKENGGFFFTGHNHEKLIQRPKPFSDEATPSGNGIAAYALTRLGHLTGEMRYLEAAERTIKSAWQEIVRVPYAHAAMLIALDEQLKPPRTIIIRSDDNKEAARWLAACNDQFLPGQMAYAIPDTVMTEGLLSGRKLVKGKTLAYLCEGTHCQAPVEKITELSVRRIS